MGYLDQIKNLSPITCFQSIEKVRLEKKEYIESLKLNMVTLELYPIFL